MFFDQVDADVRVNIRVIKTRGLDAASRLTAPALHEVIGELLQAVDEGRPRLLLGSENERPTFLRIFYLVTLPGGIPLDPDGLAVTALDTFAVFMILHVHTQGYTRRSSRPTAGGPLAHTFEHRSGNVT